MNQPAGKKRVLFVQPYAPHHRLLMDDPPEFSQPLGLLYLAAVARQAGHRVALADLGLTGAESARALDPWLKDLEPQVVGISAPFSLMAPVVEDLARQVKRRLPRTKVLVGGAHASSLPRAVLDCPQVDLVFLGESEDSLERYLSGQDPEKIEGLAFRRNGEMAANPRSGWIEDLDALPLPARDLLDLEAYWERSGRAGMGRWTSFITSRGCPFRCVFCSTHTVWGRRWRPRGPEAVAAELEELAGRFGMDTLSLEDDNFTLDMDRAKNILRLVLERGLEFNWATPNGLRADRLDPELVELMKKAGFTQAKVAVESGSPRVNHKIIHKNLDLKRAQEVVSLAADQGLPPAAFFVLGFPGETPEDMLTTIEYALELKERGLVGADFFMATPYPGTDLLDQARREGLLIVPEKDLPFANAFSPSLETPQWSADLLWFMVRLARNAFAGSAYHLDLLKRCRREGAGKVLAQGRSLGEYQMGGPESVFVLQGGWHQAEDWPPPMRWTKSRARLLLDARGRESLTISLCTHAPGMDEKPLLVTVSSGESELGSMALPDNAWRELEMPLPRKLRQEKLPVTIRVDRTFCPAKDGGAGDERIMGVAVGRVALTKGGAASRLKQKARSWLSGSTG